MRKIASVGFILAALLVSLANLQGAMALSGGPDYFGYTYIDNKGPGGPTYEWIEIRSTGTEILSAVDDSWVGNIPLGFSFNFYGASYTTISVTSNGLALTGPGTSQWSNQPIGSSDPHNFIAPFWDDLYTGGSAGAVYYQTLGTAPNRKFVAEWYDVDICCRGSSGGATFEVILYEGTNEIKFQYQDVDFSYPGRDQGGSATVGIEGPTGQGLQYSYNQAVLSAGLAILFRTQERIPPTTTVSLSGTPGGDGWYRSDVQVTLSATDNPGGSGVAKTEYSFDGTTWNLYTAPFTVSTEGANTVYYRSTDNAGNVEIALREVLYTRLDMSSLFNSDAYTSGQSYCSSGCNYPVNPGSAYADSAYGAVPMDMKPVGVNNVWLSGGIDRTAPFSTSITLNTSLPNAAAIWIVGFDGGWVFGGVPVDVAYVLDGQQYTKSYVPNDWCYSGTGSDLTLWVNRGGSCGDIAVARIDLPTRGTLTRLTVTDRYGQGYSAEPIASIPVFAVTVAQVREPLKSTTVKIDKAGPVVTAIPNRSPDHNGWYNRPLTVTFTATDALSGVASCDAPVTYSGPDGASLSVSGSCSDKAGNVGTGSFALMYDATPPTIAFITPPDGGIYLYSQEVAASYTCADTGGSGLTSCTGTAASGSNIDTGSVGGKGFTVNAADGAGNTASQSNAYTVARANTTTRAAPKTVTFGDTSVTLTATVTANAPATATVGEGAVTFTIWTSGSPSTQVGGPVSGPVSGGSAGALFNPSGLTAGTYKTKADFPATTNFTGSCDCLSGTLTVNPKPTTTTASVTPGSVQYSDLVTLSATVSPALFNGDTLTGNITFTINGTSYGPQAIGPSGVTTLSGVAIIKGPGNYTVKAAFTSTNPNFADSDNASQPPPPLTVTQEDARVTYTGSLFANTPTGSTTLALSATVEDITAVDPASDPTAGEISQGTVRFVNRDAGNATLCTAPVGLVAASDTKVGTATCNYTVALSNNENSLSITVGIIVEGYYTRNASDDDTVVTVSRQLDNFLTGGGYLQASDSAGKYAASPGSKTNFGFNVKYNKSGTHLQGHVNIIIRSGGKVYQIKSNAIDSLGVQGNKATFNSKANIQDITDPLNPISLEGNATLQLTLTDNGEPESNDTIGISVLDKNGGLLFSSNWNGTKTGEQSLGGGNLVVH